MIASIRRIAGNAASIFINTVVNRATTFVLYALIARHLGAHEFGQLSLALTLFYTFQVFAAAGLSTLITREVAKDRTKTDQYLVNGSMVVIVSSLLSITALLLFVWLMNYSLDTGAVILLMSLGLLPYALSAICEAVFQAWEMMHYIAYANMSVNIAKVGLGFLALASGYGLYGLVLLLVASHVTVLGIEWWLTLRHIARPGWKIDPRFSLDMTRSTGTFLGIDGIIAIVASISPVLLSKLTSETEVGLYSAANQVMVPVVLVFQSIALSVFPMMCRKFDSDLPSLKWISGRVIELQIAIVLPIVVGLFFLADSALLLLYGKQEFLPAAPALRIMVWALVLGALNSVLGRALLASLRESVNLRIVTVNALVNLGLSLLLISRFGLLGAAVAALLVAVVNFGQHYARVHRLLFALPLVRLMWKPTVATACMAGYLAAAASQGIWLTVTIAGAIYAGVLLALAIWSNGGPRQFKARYMYLWSE